MIKIKKIKIEPEIAIAIIFLIALFLTLIIWVESQSISSHWVNTVIRRNSTAPKKNINEARVLFASMGSRNIYKVQQDDNKWVVVMDNGQTSDAYDSVSNPTFSADGTQFAFSGTNADQTVAVINDTAESQSYGNISQIIFSPDGKSVAYVATEGQESVIVINGKASKTYQEIAPLSTPSGTTYAVFSPDGQKVAYKVVDSKGAYIVINGQAGKEYSDVSNFTFSADGTQFAYDAQIGNETVTIINNQEVINNTNPNNPPPSSATGGDNSSGGGDWTNNHTSRNIYDPSKVNFDSCKTKGGCNF